MAAPFLAEFDLEKHGLVLAGGAVSALVMHDRPSLNDDYGDFDLFLVGLATDRREKESLVALATHLLKWFGDRLKVYRTQRCFTFVCGTTCVQVILRRYTTIGEIVHGFDMGSCAMAWDGTRVYLTALSRLAAEHGVNVLNLAVRRPTYEKRLSRYHSRGYALVAPDLSPHLAASCVNQNGRPRGVIQLPFLEYFDGLMNDSSQIESDEPTKELYDSSPNYSDPKSLLLRNLGALRQVEPFLQRLVATVNLNGEMHDDLVEHSLVSSRVDFKLFAEVAFSWKKLSTFTRYFGGSSLNAAGAAMTSLLGTYPALQKICSRQVAQFTANGRAELGFKILGVFDDTALAEPSRISAADWYGRDGFAGLANPE